MISNGHIFPVEMEGCLIAGAKVCAVVETYEEYFGRHSTCKKTEFTTMSVVLVGFTLPSGNVRQKRREAKNESK